MATQTTNYNLIKPDSTDPFGDFRQDYNDNLDIIDANLGGGGGGGHTIIDPNGSNMAQRAGLQFTGSCSVTDDAVNDKTVVNISGGGGGSFFGCAIDENNKLFEGTINNFNQSLTYTATEDGIALCWYKGSVGTWQFLLVNGVMLRLGGNGTDQPVSYSIPIRKGDTVSARYQSGSESCYFWLSVYGIKQGTSGIFAPVIYSDTERKIGIWRDNKPLYQKTIEISQIPNQNTQTIAHGIANVDRIVDIKGICYARTDIDPNYASTPLPRIQDNSTTANLGVDANRTNIVLKGRGTDFASIYAKVTVTLQYTKTTDSAGSGDWNTDGVPTVHYSTNEQVIGTWIDNKPLYQRTFTYDTAQSYGSVVFSTGLTDVDEVTSFEGVASYASGGVNNKWLPFVFSNDSNGTGTTNAILKINSFLKTTGEIYAYIGADYQSTYAINRVRITLRYTKTTD